MDPASIFFFGACLFFAFFLGVLFHSYLATTRLRPVESIVHRDRPVERIVYRDKPNYHKIDHFIYQNDKSAEPSAPLTPFATKKGQDQHLPGAGYPEDEVHFLPDRQNVCNRLFDWLLGDRQVRPEQCTCEYLHGRPEEPFSCQLRVLRTILSARTQLDVCLFRITVERFTDAINHLSARGVKVRVLCHDGKAEDSELHLHRYNMDKLRGAGTNIRLKTTGQRGLMHHKFAIVDGKMLISGSANWTTNAFMHNDEVIEISEQPYKIRQYADKFEALWAASEPRVSFAQSAGDPRVPSDGDSGPIGSSNAI